MAVMRHVTLVISQVVVYFILQNFISAGST